MTQTKPSSEVPTHTEVSERSTPDFADAWSDDNWEDLNVSTCTFYTARHFISPKSCILLRTLFSCGLSNFFNYPQKHSVESPRYYQE